MMERKKEREMELCPVGQRQEEEGDKLVKKERERRSCGMDSL